jgi:hypothetical protein
MADCEFRIAKCELGKAEDRGKPFPLGTRDYALGTFRLCLPATTPGIARLQPRRAGIANWRQAKLALQANRLTRRIIWPDHGIRTI